jgi:predicted acetyltransferase
MKLICLWDADAEKAYALHQTFEEDENGFMNAAFGFTKEEFMQYIEKKEKQAEGIDLPEGYVPSTEYILVNEEGEYVGIFNLRHYLNEKLAEGAGHIGYGIRRDCRGKGYASVGLSLTLQEAKKKGIDTAYLSVHKDNPASLAVQKKAGAYIDHEDDQEYYTRIRIA